MRNMLFCVAIAALCPGIGMSRPNDSELLGFGMDVHGAVEVTYQSKYIWRGFDIYGDDPALQVTAGLTDIMGSGIGVGFAGHVATGIGHTNEERLDFTVYYADSMFPGEIFAAAYRIGWVHYNYPGLYKKQKDLEEVHGMLSWPNLTGTKNLVPSYALVGMWPAFSGSSGVGSNATGFLHFLMLDYSFAVPGAFGVQEGGILLLGAMLGIPPETALALAMVKRVREFAMGVPAIIGWSLMETRWLQRRADERMGESD